MDHLVFGVPDLAQGIELVEGRTGVRASFGGQHPGRGTHNALQSLGGRQYLEIIARDPDQRDAPGLLFPGLEGLSEPRFIAWAVAVKSVADIAKRARAANIVSIGPLDGSRAQSDGSLLTWKTLRIDSPIEGAPFFIAFVDEQVDGTFDLALDTRTPEGAVLLETLMAKAAFVVRGLR